MIKSIIVVGLVILSIIEGSWLVPQSKLPTHCIDGNSELRMTGDKHAAGMFIGFHWRKSLLQRAINPLHFTNQLG